MDFHWLNEETPTNALVDCQFTLLSSPMVVKSKLAVAVVPVVVALAHFWLVFKPFKR